MHLIRNRTQRSFLTAGLISCSLAMQANAFSQDFNASGINLVNGVVPPLNGLSTTNAENAPNVTNTLGFAPNPGHYVYHSAVHDTDFPNLGDSSDSTIAGNLAGPHAAKSEDAINADQSREIIELRRRLEALEFQNSAAAQNASGTTLVPTRESSPSFPSLNIHGAFQADAVMFNQDDASRDAYGRIESGVDFRRARLGAKGAVSDRMEYLMQLDFGFFGRPTFTDLWVDFKDVGPLGTVRVGQWKHPFSLEVSSSYRYTTFMERSVLFQAFTPFRHLGVGFYDHSEDLNWTWAASYLRSGQDQFGASLSTDGGNGLAGRITHLPWYLGAQGDRYLHLGAAYYLNAPANDRTRFRTIPEIYVGEFSTPAGEPIGTSGQAIPSVANGTPYFADTGSIQSDLTQTLGLESLWVRGPLSWQTEFMGAFVDTTQGGRFLHGAYSQIGFFLTGEHRSYDRKSGAVDRVIPHYSLDRSNCGWGAWEVAGRWSYIDLTDEHILGGDMQDMTIGLNWYVNAYCKCAFNYIRSWSDTRPIRNGTILSDDYIASTTDAFGMRCQIDF